MEEYDAKIENTGGAVFLAVCRGKVRSGGDPWGRWAEIDPKGDGRWHASRRAWRGMTGLLVVRFDTRLEG